MVTRRALVIAAVAVGIYLFRNGGPVFPGKQETNNYWQDKAANGQPDQRLR